MQNNPEIEQILESAVDIAHAQKHEYVITEHVLLALIRHETFRRVLEKFGVEVTLFDQELLSYINSLTSMAKDPATQPKKTNALERVFNRALTQVLFTGRRQVSTIDLMVAMLAETNSHAHYFLMKYGIKKQEFVEFWRRFVWFLATGQ